MFKIELNFLATMKGINFSFTISIDLDFIFIISSLGKFEILTKILVKIANVDE